MGSGLDGNPAPFAPSLQNEKKRLGFEVLDKPIDISTTNRDGTRTLQDQRPNYLATGGTGTSYLAITVLLGPLRAKQNSRSLKTSGGSRLESLSEPVGNHQDVMEVSSSASRKPSSSFVTEPVVNHQHVMEVSSPVSHKPS